MRSDVAMKTLALLAVALSGVAFYGRWDEIKPLFTTADALQARPAPPGEPGPLDSFDASNLTVAASEILSGGPGKDGIPALTNPKAVDLDGADFLDAGARVVGVEIGGHSRAYPIGLLNWHEIINDQLGGVPVAIVYCPLCDSVSVVDRRIDNRELAFGVSGLLHNSNVLLYDRSDHALWSQVGLEAISGPLAGQSLRHLPFSLTDLAAWGARHPDTSVVSFETGHLRNYGRNPYANYFGNDSLMFPVQGESDTTFPNKEPIVGVRVGEQTRAYPVAVIARAPGGRVEDKFGGGTVMLEAQESGTHVEILEAPEEAQVVHTFWFAWKAFHPETTIYTAGPR